MKKLVTATAICASLSWAGAAFAEPLDAATARSALFEGDGLALASGDLTVFTPALAEHYKSIVTGKGAQTFLAQAQASGIVYYGAIAAPKASAPTIQTLTMGGNAHSPGAAAAEVLAACETAAGEDCAVVAYIVPESYSKQPLTLSASATAGVFESFGDGGPRYLAYSPATAGYAIAKGQGADAAALDACNEATGGRDDCVIGIVEE